VVDDRDSDGGCVADGEFVVSGGEAAVVFEDVDAAFDGVPVAVDDWVECWWPSAVGASVGAVSGLVGRNWDGCLDPAAGQPCPIRP
jgi:hypothetical protein